MLKMPYPAFERLLEALPQPPATHVGRFIPSPSFPLTQRLRAYSIHNATWSAATVSQGLAGLPKNILNRILDPILTYPSPIHLERKTPERVQLEVSDKDHELLIVSQDPDLSNAVGMDTASPTNAILISNAISELAVAQYYDTNTFHFSNRSALQSWTADIPERRDFVTSIVLEAFVDLTFAGPELLVQNIRVTQTGGVILGATDALTWFPSLAQLEVQVYWTMNWRASHASLSLPLVTATRISARRSE